LFSAREHKGQVRASGEPYLVHPLEVANILADMRLDAVSVSTGLLHDVVEDTLVDLDTIKQYFGEEVTHLVDGLTKIAQISNVSHEEQQAENVRKMLLAMVNDVRVVLVKLADRLHNMRTLQFLKPENASASRRKRWTFMRRLLIGSAWVNFAANSKTLPFAISTRKIIAASPRN
jgi:GTP pyrophosphokinase